MEKNVVSARAASLQGLDCMHQEKWDEAERIFAGAVKACPSDERAQGCYAETLWRRGSCDAAIGHMQEAAKLSGNDPQRLVQLGEMHLALRNFPKAAECADAAIEKNCRLHTAWALRGNVHVARGQTDDALSDYHRALAYEPHQPAVQIAVANIYLQQKREPRALSVLETLVEQCPPGEAPVEALGLAGGTLRRLGRHAEATEMLSAACSRGAPTAELLYQLADSQHQIGDASAAAATLGLALTQDPQHHGSLALRDQLATGRQALTAQLNTGTVMR